jgi:hypothetical protein
MKKNRKMMVSVLLILAVLSIGITPIFAVSDCSRGVEKAHKMAQNKRIVTNVNEERYAIQSKLRQRLQSLFVPLDISDLDESEIDDKFIQVEEADSTEEISRSILWYLNARGMSTPLESVTDSADLEKPIGVQLLVEKVKITDYGILYEVLWGRIIHIGEKIEVKGYAIVDSDGVFYLKLIGEDLELKSIGRVARTGIGVRIEMKGYMNHDGEDFNFKMHGRALPLNIGLFRNRTRNYLKPEESTSVTKITPDSII